MQNHSVILSMVTLCCSRSISQIVLPLKDSPQKRVFMESRTAVSASSLSWRLFSLQRHCQNFSLLHFFCPCSISLFLSFNNLIDLLGLVVFSVNICAYLWNFTGLLYSCCWLLVFFKVKTYSSIDHSFTVFMLILHWLSSFSRLLVYKQLNLN